MTEPRIVGQGSKGCVFSPSLPCSDGTDAMYARAVSKVMLDEHATAELEENQRVAQLDPQGKFTLRAQRKCTPLQESRDLIAQCDDAIKFVNPAGINSETRLLIMENGGEDLYSLFERLKDSAPSEATKAEMHNFWLASIPVFEGLQVLLKAQLCHHDVKIENIIFDGRIMKLIDFGEMQTFDTLKQWLDTQNQNYKPRLNHPPDAAIHKTLANKCSWNKDYWAILDWREDEAPDREKWTKKIEESKEKVNSRYSNDPNEKNLLKNETCETWDLYGFAFALLIVLQYTRPHQTYGKEIQDILLPCVLPDPTDRPLIGNVISDLSAVLLTGQINRPTKRSRRGGRKTKIKKRKLCTRRIRKGIS